ncbi:glycosyltransferase family 2 protein [Fibrella sp. ES10-3-2-2]|nr:hypothetical protein A6C57_05910 [Fibrella sp. ES10-3-2-2]
MNAKKVSIALATYNGQKYLEDLLASLVEQSYPIYEIIVCDDISDDNSIKILNKYKLHLPIKIYVNEKKLGVIKNFQRAISLCTGDWVACCDQDDVWMSNKLEISVNALNTLDESKPALVFSDLTVTDKDLVVITNSYWKMININPLQTSLYSLLFGNIVTGCTMLMNKPMCIEMIYIPEEAIMHDYWAACIAFTYRNYKVIPQPTIFYRQHGNNVTTNTTVTIYSRFLNLIKSLNGEFSNYLNPELKQAKVFYYKYNSIMSLEQKEDLEKFLRLKRIYPTIRKIFKYYFLIK